MSGGFKRTYWPELSTATDAEKAVKGAAYIAFFVAALTGVLSLLAWLSVAQIVTRWAIFDALVIGLVGVFILRGSRAAAVLGLILYVVEVGATIVATGNPAGLVIGVIFTFAFINGVRGGYFLKRPTGAADASGALDP